MYRNSYLENAANAFHAFVDALKVGVDACLSFRRLNEENCVRHIGGGSREGVNASREGVKASRGDVTRDEVSELPKQLNL